MLKKKQITIHENNTSTISTSFFVHNFELETNFLLSGGACIFPLSLTRLCQSKIRMRGGASYFKATMDRPTRRKSSGKSEIKQIAS